MCAVQLESYLLLFVDSILKTRQKKRLTNVVRKLVTWCNDPIHFDTCPKVIVV